MTQIGNAQGLVRAQAGTRRELRDLFKAAAQEASGAIARYAGPDGIVPLRDASRAAADAGQIVQDLFVTGRESLDDDGTPITPIAQVITFWTAKGIQDAVEAHTRFLEKTAPSDVLAFLRSGRFAEPNDDDGRVIFEQDEGDIFERFEHLRLFGPNPVADSSFDASRQWVRPDKWQDPRGYTLSQRIWEASTRTRNKIDAFVHDAIRNGTGALQLSRILEQFLTPGRARLRTRKPYGTDASFDAMRLARSEIGRTFNAASWVSSYLNPYVQTMDWRLSPSHPRFDICDGLAAGSPYSVHTTPIPVSASHPQCICSLIPNVTDDPRTATRELREAIDESRRVNVAPHLTPAAGDQFVGMLLGNAIHQFLITRNPVQMSLFDLFS